MFLAEPLEVTLAVTQVLERLGVDYLVGGSLASSLHGVPRATLDVDLLVDLRTEHVASFARALERDFFVDTEMIADAVHRRATFNILHVATMLKVDVFVVSDDELLVQEMARRQRVRVRDDPPIDLYLATAEDIVLQKLLWYRSGGCVSDRQWTDVVGVLRAQGQRLDRDYLRRWGAVKKLGDLLGRAIDDAGVDGL